MFYYHSYLTVTLTILPLPIVVCPPLYHYYNLTLVCSCLVSPTLTMEAKSSPPFYHCNSMVTRPSVVALLVMTVVMTQHQKMCSIVITLAPKYIPLLLSLLTLMKHQTLLYQDNYSHLTAVHHLHRSKAGLTLTISSHLLHPQSPHPLGPMYPIMT